MRVLVFLFLPGLAFIITSFSGCDREGMSNCQSGCVPVEVLATITPARDTFYVGDTMTLEFALPDSFPLVEDGDTTFIPITSFKNAWTSCNILKLDVHEASKLDLDYDIDIEILAGGESFQYFTEHKPFIHKEQYIFKEPGVYFHSTGGDNEGFINAERVELIMDYKIPQKHFDWLTQYIEASGGTVQEWEEYDIQNITNIFPFRVIAK